MPAITIRDVPEDTRHELAARAARSGRSLQEYLRSTLIELADRPDPSELATRIAGRKERLASAIDADRIVAHLDSDRR